MSVRQDLITEARTWYGTPYRHQANVKGENGGVDCVGLITGVCLNLGLITKEDMKNVPAYPQEWHLHQEIPLLTDVMKKFGCVEKKVLNPIPGDLVVFKIGKVPSHLGMLLDGEPKMFIHALGKPVGKVVTTPLDGPWKKKMVAVYKLPGV